jgi:hypothetical protein
MEPQSLNGDCSLEAQAWEPTEGEARRDGIVVVFEDDMQVRRPRSFAALKLGCRSFAALKLGCRVGLNSESKDAILHRLRRIARAAAAGERTPCSPNKPQTALRSRRCIGNGSSGCGGRTRGARTSLGSRCRASTSSPRPAPTPSPYSPTKKTRFLVLLSSPSGVC